jgi:hypothetical protein
MQIQHKSLDINRTAVSLVSIVQLLHAVDWGAPTAQVTASGSVTSEGSHASSSTDADASNSGGTSASFMALQHQRSRQGFRASSATGVNGPMSTNRGESDNAFERIALRQRMRSCGGSSNRQLVAHVAPEAEFVLADNDRILQVTTFALLAQIMMFFLLKSHDARLT